MNWRWENQLLNVGKFIAKWKRVVAQRAKTSGKTSWDFLEKYCKAMFTVLLKFSAFQRIY